MTTTQAPSGGVKLADLAGDFGDDEPAPTQQQASAPARAREPERASTPAPDAPKSDEPESDEDTAEAGKPRRRARPADEHVATAAALAGGGLGGLSVPTLAEVVSDQHEAIYEFRSLWWRVPRGIYAIVYLLVWIAAVLTLLVLDRVRYAVTAGGLIGGVWLAYQLWGAGL